MPYKPYELIWAHISCYSCLFLYYIQMQLTYIYPVSCLVEIKLLQIVSKLFLGLMWDSQLLWREHISMLKAKCPKSTKFTPSRLFRVLGFRPLYIDETI